jgi:hypothetical protein
LSFYVGSIISMPLSFSTHTLRRKDTIEILCNSGGNYILWQPLSQATLSVAGFRSQMYPVPLPTTNNLWSFAIGASGHRPSGKESLRLCAGCSEGCLSHLGRIQTTDQETREESYETDDLVVATGGETYRVKLEKLLEDLAGKGGNGMNPDMRGPGRVATKKLLSSVPKLCRPNFRSATIVPRGSVVQTVVRH